MLKTLLQDMQVLVIPCKPCNTIFYNMPALCIVNQQVMYGLHVLHEIGNFFLIFQWIINRCDYSYMFDVGSMGITVANSELSLVGSDDFT